MEQNFWRTMMNCVVHRKFMIILSMICSSHGSASVTCNNPWITHNKFTNKWIKWSSHIHHQSWWTLHDLFMLFVVNFWWIIHGMNTWIIHNIFTNKVYEKIITCSSSMLMNTWWMIHSICNEFLVNYSWNEYMNYSE